MPFIGVNGEDACGNIYDGEGKEKVACSEMKQGVEYTYDTSIFVQPFYPVVSNIISIDHTCGWKVESRGQKEINVYLFAQFTNIKHLILTTFI